MSQQQLCFHARRSPDWATICSSISWRGKTAGQAREECIKTDYIEQKYLAQNKAPNSTHYTVAEAYNLATIRGARAAKMGDRVGSIAEGKQADLVIFSGTSPGMVGAAQHDPVAAIILHSNPGDIEYVIVDGVVRKSAGKLINVNIDKRAQDHIGQVELSWGMWRAR